MLGVAEPVFRTGAAGAIYKADNGGATLFYSASTEFGPEQRWKARNSERLDTLYRAIVQTNPIVSQVYFNSHDNMSRVYPFLPNAEQLFSPIEQMSDYPFYYLADAMHNPQREAVWTSAYLDPAGMGWMVSAIAPVYNGDVLEGVLGLDITLKSLVDKLFSQQYVSASKVFFLDQQQTLLAMSPDMASLLGMQELTSYHYEGKQPAQQNMQKPQGFQLQALQDQQFSRDVLALLHSEQTSGQITVHNTDYIVARVPVLATGWQMFILQDMSQVMLPLQQLEQTWLSIAVSVFVLLLLGNALYLHYVYRRSRRFAHNIVVPINQLAEQTLQLGKKGVVSGNGLADSPIREVAVLAGNFSRMAAELEERTQRLAKANTARSILEEKARLYQIMASTDQLTGLHNRKHLDTILRHEGIRSQRYGTQLSLMMLDIDHFKRINDNFGHQVGDQVLKQVARCLKNALRESDVLGRWGGEEFLLLCPNTGLQDASLLAEKLRQQVEQLKCHDQLIVTVSIGVAQMQQGERTEQTIGRADAMLYRSKHHGRNQVSLDIKEDR